jgi:hypothetical protein
MNTYNFKEAIKVLAHGGFMQEPPYYFSKHAPLFDASGKCIGQITYNCYFELANALGCENTGGIRIIDRYNSGSYGYETINGNLSIFKKEANHD